MLARVLLGALFVSPAVAGAGLGWAVGAGYGLVLFAGGLFACSLIALTLDVFPDPPAANREVTR